MTRFEIALGVYPLSDVVIKLNIVQNTFPKQLLNLINELPKKVYLVGGLVTVKKGISDQGMTLEKIIGG